MREEGADEHHTVEELTQLQCRGKGHARTVYGDHGKTAPAAILRFGGRCLIVLYNEVVAELLSAEIHRT
jgi:hypothetical protein